MVTLQDVARTYQVGGEDVRALREANLAIDGGEYVSIMGPSGSGKSTLLHILGLLDRPTSGRYTFEGQDVTALDERTQARVRRERIGFVFQFFHLVPRMSASENVELPMVLAGIPPAERRRRVARALESFGLADRARHRPDQLSGGQRQRVAIARATIMEPALLLADEPTGNLDRDSGHDVLELLEGLHSRGLALVVVTHDPEIGRRAGRRIRMFDGRIVEDQAP
ncbi:MAG: ABC transporter ATP-binding protein [Acidobacteria bacterium]|nr:ABC transporter ATP-binding protein [Acidobacteriota bacterium]